jgi:hypothetical protein
MNIDAFAAVVAAWCNDLDTGLRGGRSVEDLARMLVVIRDARAALAVVADHVAAVFVHQVRGRETVVDGLGVFAIRRSVRRTQWDHERLWRAVVARALDERHLDFATGEYEPAYEAVARVLAVCVAPTWRVTALRGRGIDESEYCHVVADKATVQLPSSAPTRPAANRLAGDAPE